MTPKKNVTQSDIFTNIRKKEKLLKLKPYKQIVINLIFWEWNARFSHAKQVFWPQTTTHTD